MADQPQEYKEEKQSLTSEQIDQCIALLQCLNQNTDQIWDMPENQKRALMKAAGQLSRPNRDEYQRRRKDAKKAAKRKQVERDKHARKETGIRSAREASVFVAPTMIDLTGKEADKELELSTPRNCYVCKTMYNVLHHFYDTMCKECGDFNYAKRFQTASMKGQVALVTGSRLKIGYHITLMMLRAGATVIATTRFPVDSALRYSKEEDFTVWGHRLKIHGLDLRHIPSVEIFCNYVEQQYKRLDVLINNAAQTVRRPTGFYKHLMSNEASDYNDLPRLAQDLLRDHHDIVQELSTLTLEASDAENKNAPVAWQGKQIGVGLTSSAQLSQIPYTIDNSLATEEVFPDGKLDADLQQVDLRTTNSWRLKLGEISTDEMLEVQLVNSVAPFVLCNRLATLMKKENTGMKHIIKKIEIL